jgi:hypothetical protein
LRAGVIINGQSHRNRGAGARPPIPDGVATAYPVTLDDLDQAVAGFARLGIEILVIDGGDGTIRDVLTAAARHFPAGLPAMAVLPSGKTNALAIDLGVPRGWDLDSALRCAAEGHMRLRSSLQIWRPGASFPELCGFLFGTAAFVRATQTAQRAHRLGAFDALGVGVALATSALQTLFGGPRDGWRAGEFTGLSVNGGPMEARARFTVMASTLKRLPLGLMPFGPPREGMKLLSADAPPVNLSTALPRILSGRDTGWLAAAGYHLTDVEAIGLSHAAQFVLDGDIYPGGDFQVRRGPELAFAAPPKPTS